MEPYVKPEMELIPIDREEVVITSGERSELPGQPLSNCIPDLG